MVTFEEVIHVVNWDIFRKIMVRLFALGEKDEAVVLKLCFFYSRTWALKRGRPNLQTCITAVSFFFFVVVSFFFL